MKKKIVIRIQFLILFSFTFFSPSIGQNSDSLLVKLKLNRLVFTPDDTIGLSIINLTDDTLYIYDPKFSSESIILKKKINNSWITLNIQKYSGGIRWFERSFLQHDTIRFRWNQTINIFDPEFRKEKASKCKYRFEFRFWKDYIKRNGTSIGYLKTDEYYFIQSKEFEIE